MSARDDVLGAVRAALRDVPRTETPDAVPVPRAYRRAGTPAAGDVVARFAERAADYRATVTRTGADTVAAFVAAALERRGAERVVVPAGVPDGWLTDVPAAGATLVPDDGTLTAADLDALDGVVTGCAVAVAETGTLVLDGGPAQGRRALTLVPDYHLCVVRAEQVVAGVPDAVAALDPRRPLTWVSGPSATSDIELNRVEGVHGPRTLEILLLT